MAHVVLVHDVATKVYESMLLAIENDTPIDDVGNEAYSLVMSAMQNIACTGLCNGTTQKGSKCKHKVGKGKIYCALHADQRIRLPERINKDAKVLCGGTTKKGQLCKRVAYTIEGFCHTHMYSQVQEDIPTRPVQACNGTTTSGNECKNKVQPRKDFCFFHSKARIQTCSGVTKKGMCNNIVHGNHTKGKYCMFHLKEYYDNREKTGEIIVRTDTAAPAVKVPIRVRETAPEMKVIERMCAESNHQLKNINRHGPTGPLPMHMLTNSSSISPSVSEILQRQNMTATSVLSGQKIEKAAPVRPSEPSTSARSSAVGPFGILKDAEPNTGPGPSNAFDGPRPFPWPPLWPSGPSTAATLAATGLPAEVTTGLSSTFVATGSSSTSVAHVVNENRKVQSERKGFTRITAEPGGTEISSCPEDYGEKEFPVPESMYPIFAQRLSRSKIEMPQAAFPMSMQRQIEKQNEKVQKANKANKANKEEETRASTASSAASSSATASSGPGENSGIYPRPGELSLEELCNATFVHKEDRKNGVFDKEVLKDLRPREILIGAYCGSYKRVKLDDLEENLDDEDINSVFEVYVKGVRKRDESLCMYKEKIKQLKE